MRWYTLLPPVLVLLAQVACASGDVDPTASDSATATPSEGATEFPGPEATRASRPGDNEAAVPSQPPSRYEQYVWFEDPIGDNSGLAADVTGLLLSFDRASGAYEVVLTAHPAAPFDGGFRININLGLGPAEQVNFSHNQRDFLLDTPLTVLVMEGQSDDLTSWNPGDLVSTTGRGFRSAVTEMHSQRAFHHEDTIDYRGEPSVVSSSAHPTGEPTVSRASDGSSTETPPAISTPPPATVTRTPPAVSTPRPATVTQTPPAVTTPPQATVTQIPTETSTPAISPVAGSCKVLEERYCDSGAIVGEGFSATVVFSAPAGAPIFSPLDGIVFANNHSAGFAGTPAGAWNLLVSGRGADVPLSAVILHVPAASDLCTAGECALGATLSGGLIGFTSGAQVSGASSIKVSLLDLYDPLGMDVARLAAFFGLDER